MKLVQFLAALFCLGYAIASLPTFRVSKHELKGIVNEMRSRDVNRARAGQVRINTQQHCGTSRSFYDRSSHKLFSYVDQSLLRKDTFKKFKALLNNYNRKAGQVEHETQREKREQRDFLHAVFRTDVFQRLYNFLHLKRHPFARRQDYFRSKVKALWFGRYSRARGVKDTSGFEHVMVGESKNNQVGGLHSWVQFYLLEKANALDYKCFLVKRSQNMVAARFQWERETKLSGTFLVGTSPEFDLALYTLCFLSHRGERNPCEFEIDHCPMQIISHDSRQEGQDFVGTIFPKAGKSTRACQRGTRRDN